MDQVIPVIGTMALLGSALVGGIFFAFSSFVMKALAGVPSSDDLSELALVDEQSIPVLNAHQPVGTALGTGGFDEQVVDVAFAVAEAAGILTVGLFPNASNTP